jgi:hypothetical protein
LIGDLVEVESASGWVSLEEVDECLLIFPVVVDEGDV